MKIQVNGKTEEIENDAPVLTELLKILNIERPEMVSVELNGDFVEREDFESTIIKSDDQIEFLYFMGGGA